jgi:hypothetical protein
MFESAIVGALKNDNELSALLTKYKGEPAIFSPMAPEGAKMPFVTFRIVLRNAEGGPIQDFYVFCDVYDRSTNAEPMRKAVERIEYTLERAHLTHERYDTIRMFQFAGSDVPEENPCDLHYNIQFKARAGRKKWMQQFDQEI